MKKTLIIVTGIILLTNNMLQTTGVEKNSEFNDVKLPVKKVYDVKLPVFATELCMEDNKENVYEYTPEKRTAEKINELKLKFPHGTFWNSSGKACNHEGDRYAFCNEYSTKAGSGMQCHGFALMISDEIFGTDAPVNVYSDVSEMKIGDIVRYNDRHTMLITEMFDNYVTVAEANFNHDCQITWGRTVTKEFLESCTLWCVSRY